MSSVQHGPGPADAGGELTVAAVRPQLSAVADAVLGPGERVEVGLVALGERRPGSGPVDLVWAGPDDLPRLVAADALHDALRAARGALRPGGLVVLAAPDPDELAALHAAEVTSRAEDGATVLAAWQVSADGLRYSRHDLRLRLGEDGWACEAAEPVTHRVPGPDEVSSALEAAGFWSPQLLGRSETGLAVAVWAAVAPADEDGGPGRDAPPPTDGAAAVPAPAG